MACLSLAIIGCGRIAQTAHARALADLSNRVRLTATADIELDAAKRVAQPWGADAYSDYRRVLDRPDVDAVIVSTPEFMHHEQVVAAAAAGKHVLCEKPMANSLREADAMIAACERANVRLLVGHSRRFTRRYLEVERVLRSGEIGDVRLVRENERRNRSFGGLSKVLWRPGHWSGDPKTSHGVALMAGVHEADILRWFVGAEAVSVYAQHDVTGEGNVGIPDFISFTVKFSNGGIGSSEISRLPPGSYPAFHQLEVYGQRGLLRAKDSDSVSVSLFHEQGASFPAYEEILMATRYSYTRQLLEFVAAIDEKRTPRVSPYDARAALSIALAAVESAKTGLPVAPE
ncbi:Gfo/Idh/MocA family protein [Pseudorhodoplanes sp.]|uniref:Gfo/Idh/MocA family protein n=1 Tax=Pseudorhodoplanes sp. TaxID=1934341 RepID=UPI003D0DA851